MHICVRVCVHACARVTRGQSPLPGSEQLGAGPSSVSLPQPREVPGLPQEPFAQWFSYAHCHGSVQFPWGGHFCPPFTNKGTKAQRGERTWPKVTQ